MYSFPDTLVMIGKECFCGSQIYEISFPPSVSFINDKAFYNIATLRNLYFEDGELSNPLMIGMEAFKNCRITKLTLPSHTEMVGDSSFKGCKINELILPNNLKFIGRSAFCGLDLSSHYNYVFPKELTEIGQFAFAGSSIGPAVTFFDKVRTIDTCSFSECTNIHKISIGQKDKDI
jgi:hypothetical protein